MEIVKDFLTTPFPCVRAGNQTHGRGQRGKTWGSLSGNLMMSFAMPVTDFQRPSDLCFLTGVALVEALNEPMIHLKWPNDIFLGDAKIGGILVESHENFLICGMGLNIKSHPFLENPAYPVTSLQAHGSNLDANQVLIEFEKSFFKLKKLYEVQPDILFELWQRRALWLGKKVILSTPSQVDSGVFQGINAEGALILDGEIYYHGTLRLKESVKN